MNRRPLVLVLLAFAALCFILVVLSAFGSDVTLNELGWTALGLAAVVAALFAERAG
jgi:hypothetical protein